MLASERQKKIKELVTIRHSLKISELSEMFQVSEMTIHRDIKPMVESGIIEKSFGGISLVSRETKGQNSNECVLCHRSLNQRLAFRLILTENRVETACCSHCGILRHQMLGDEVLETLCSDFFTDTTISATTASFVMDATIDLGCCQPQVIPFKHREHAEGFVKGFSGTVVSYTEAMGKVTGQMGKSKGCCHHG
ncbi:DeoR/GlpR transcriptional regulator [Robertmurraya yapensis]|uniref:DeoR/GlpR transcriptional regulator n=2 Tax=Bacillaceae TaxID=186817 RepID=A0A3S0KQ63_9BACI|nr:DeoR family transcriptional regulator [Bacillus yapensis]RTR35763.1 DeoR/GlpR transcriptional regulator [Bacillus yapensis]TKS98565.1 DeoR family transcriptional regulator [Bacillus yapensis]